MMHMPSYFWDNTNFCKPFPMTEVNWLKVKIQPAPGVILPSGSVGADGTIVDGGSSGPSAAPGAAAAPTTASAPSTADTAADPTVQL
jgi:hypothetical protein